MLRKTGEWLAVGLAVWWLQAWCGTVAIAADESCPKKTRCVIVAEPYLEMHSGPGVGYPVVYVAERGEEVQVLVRRTDWFYVRTQRQVEGWASRDQILATLEVTGEPVDLKEPTRTDYASHDWEGGIYIGRFEGASLLGLQAGYAISDHLTAVLSTSIAVGNLRDSYVATIGLDHAFAPEWRATPYFGIGTGIINIRPHSTLVQPSNRTNQIGYADIGVRGYLARRFLVRFEYRGNVVFTKRNENEEINEWRLGFGFFF